MASPVQVPPTRRQRRSFAGPVVTDHRGHGLLLANMGVLHWDILGFWFAHYWPLLIILWGIVKLVEYQQAQKEGVRPRGIGAGGMFLLVVLIVLVSPPPGCTFNWKAVGDHIDIDDDNFTCSDIAIATMISWNRHFPPTPPACQLRPRRVNINSPTMITFMWPFINVLCPTASPMPTSGMPAPSR